jgi:hypothetical protein
MEEVKARRGGEAASEAEKERKPAFHGSGDLG